MNKQRGLGRGLGAFFPAGAATARTDEIAAASRVAMIPVDHISPNPFQPRHDLDAGELESLAQSIRAHGVLSPILVRAAGTSKNRFELLAGERRWRAARMAGLAQIPALVRDARDAQALEIALLENLQRTDLNAIEEAAGYRQLMDEHGFTQETLSQRLGKARPTVANALRLLSLPDGVQAMIRDGRISAGHGRALAALPKERAEVIARSAISRGLSVRDVERLAGAASGAKAKKTVGSSNAARSATTLTPELSEIETRMRFALATRVALHPGAIGGTIEIRYADDDELARILDVICREEV